jgi:hypothetical protein
VDDTTIEVSRHKSKLLWQGGDFTNCDRGGPHRSCKRERTLFACISATV